MVIGTLRIVLVETRASNQLADQVIAPAEVQELETSELIDRVVVELVRLIVPVVEVVSVIGLVEEPVQVIVRAGEMG